MKILLINPKSPARTPLSTEEKLIPIGLAYIGAICEKEESNVKVIDDYLLNLPYEKLGKKISEASPDLVGVTMSSLVYSEAVKTMQLCKKIVPDAKIIAGGPHPTVMPEKTLLGIPELDAVVIGEGEKTVSEIIERFRKNRGFRGVKGTCFRKGKKIVKNPPRPFIENLDELPFPAWHLFPIKKYPRKTNFLSVVPVDNINSSRGCPFRCAFCSVKSIWGLTYRYFSPERTTEEIKHLVESYGTKGIYFREDNFTLNKKRVEKLCKLIIKENLDVKWVCESRVNLITKDIAKLMKRAGCETIWFGTESGSQRVLDKVLCKGITLEQTKRAFKILDDAGIRRGASFMVGVPGETIKDMYKTIKFTKEIDPDYTGFNIFVGIPKSPIHDRIMANHWYENVDAGGVATGIKTDEFTPADVLKIQKIGEREVMFNLKFLKRKLRECKSLSNLAMTIKAGLKVIKTQLSSQPT
ncbi:Anaerobic magnesium-protoporphyrin IX monomethyl ester cyclase [subsurface metagenome]